MKHYVKKEENKTEIETHHLSSADNAESENNYVH